MPEGITIIDIRCFKNTEIEEVVLPSSIKEIGWQAFMGCENLRRINLPEGLEIIGG